MNTYKHTYFNSDNAKRIENNFNIYLYLYSSSLYFHIFKNIKISLISISNLYPSLNPAINKSIYNDQKYLIPNHSNIVYCNTCFTLNTNYYTNY